MNKLIYNLPSIPTLGFYDLILIAFIEVGFIWFFFPEELMGKVFQMVGAVNLIKVGAMSLFYSIIPSFTSTLNQILLVEVTIVFILGIIASTLIYEKEKWSPTREQAGALAFRITAISSLIWVTFKSIQPRIYFDPFVSYDLRLASSEGSITDGFLAANIITSGLPTEFFGLLILILGCGIIYFKYKKKSVNIETIA